MTPKPLPSQRREYGEPSEQMTPLPRTLLILVVGLVSWGAWYLSQSAPEASARLGDARTTAAFTQAAAASGPADGGQIYTSKCAACHQATGVGVAGVFPPLAASEWVTGRQEVIVQILLHGINGPIEVRDVAYNGLMPQWKTLRDDEIAAVTTYIRANFGNRAPPIDAAFVAAERAKTADRTVPWSGGEELEDLP